MISIPPDSAAMFRCSDPVRPTVLVDLVADCAAHVIELVTAERDALRWRVAQLEAAQAPPTPRELATMRFDTATVTRRP
jgi:hypothetical protein